MFMIIDKNKNTYVIDMNNVTIHNFDYKNVQKHKTISELNKEVSDFIKRERNKGDV